MLHRFTIKVTRQYTERTFWNTRMALARNINLINYKFIHLSQANIDRHRQSVQLMLRYYSLASHYFTAFNCFHLQAGLNGRNILFHFS